MNFKVKDGANVINLDENASIGIHWVAINFKNDKIAFHILIVLELSTFQKNSQEIEILLRIFLEHKKPMIQ